jgi:carboxyl-terminal processing protease
VVSPIDDTPAFRAGVKAGDYISHIDGEQVFGLTLSEAVEKMRGKIGSSIEITVVREGEQEPLKLSMVRDLIKIQSVRSRPEKDIGYVRITSFSEKTASGLDDALTALKKEIPEMKGLVLDLRNNPGGLLDQAIEVADRFLEHGEIVSTRERNPENTRRYAAKAGEIAPDLPIVVLINNGSASASEIVAGALQDHKRAVVLGTKSFGKGSVQTVIPLKDHGAMRLTTSRYYTPSGRSIQATGIEPDILVEPSKITPLEVSARKEADLRGSLKNEQAPDPRALFSSSGADHKPGWNADDKKEDNPDKDMASQEDFQLARALDLLRGLSVYKAVSTQ